MSLEFTLHSIARSIFTDELLDSFLAEDQKTVDQRDPFLQARSIRKRKPPWSRSSPPPKPPS